MNWSLIEFPPDKRAVDGLKGFIGAIPVQVRTRAEIQGVVFDPRMQVEETSIMHPFAETGVVDELHL
jgi:hypothetical protein